jgi:hypothetical protein
VITGSVPVTNIPINAINENANIAVFVLYFIRIMQFLNMPVVKGELNIINRGCKIRKSSLTLLIFVGAVGQTPQIYIQRFLL